MPNQNMLFSKHFFQMKYDDSKNRYNQPSCLVCLMDFEHNEYIRKIGPCRHIFHEACLKSWLDKNRNYPVCKADLENDILERKDSWGFDNLKGSKIPENNNDQPRIVNGLHPPAQPNVYVMNMSPKMPYFQ